MSVHWKFDVGECISVKEFAGIVAERTRSLDGTELYSIMLAFDDERSHGVTTGGSAERVVEGGPLCKDCPLWFNGRCGSS